MASPQNRTWRGPPGSTPVRSSLLARTPSTPLDLYRTNASQGSSATYSSPGHSSSFLPASPGSASRRASLRPTPLSSSVSPTIFLSSPDRDGPGSPYRRNAAFGSPGASASRNAARLSSTSGAVAGTPRSSASTMTSATPSKGQGSQSLTPLSSTPKGARQSGRFIRKKTLRQRIEEMPEAIYDWLSMAPSMFLADPSLGYPAGGALHVISLLAMAMHPDSALHTTGGGARNGRRLGQSAGGSLFAHDRNTGGVGLASRKLQRQQDAWRSSASLLIFFLLALAAGNAYSLFTAKRRYHLWLKPTSEKLASENASLVDLPRPDFQAPEFESSPTTVARALEVGHSILRGIVTVLAWLWALLLWRLRQIPYVGVIFRVLFASPGSQDRSRRTSSASTHPQMHALDVWQAPEVQLRIFCVYSPLHALFYLVLLKAGRAGLDGSVSSLMLCSLLMGATSAQAYLLATFYKGLVKDKTLLAAEVMNEYDQKFVLPRAMPEVRDASTQTSPSDYETALQPRQPSVQEWRGTFMQHNNAKEEGEDEDEDNIESLPSANSSSLLSQKKDKSKKSRTRKSVI